MTRRMFTSDNIGNAVLTATAAQAEAILGVAASIVASTSTALALTVTQHANRIVDWAPNSSGAATATLPAATGSKERFTIINSIAQTQGSVVVAALGTDVLSGIAKMFHTTQQASGGGAYLTTATSDKLTMNRTTTGGLGFDKVQVIDWAAGVWMVEAELVGNGALATPFSAT